jgi:hypothetical protein
MKLRVSCEMSWQKADANEDEDEEERVACRYNPFPTKEILIYKESLYKPIASCSLLIFLCVEPSMGRFEKHRQEAS